MKKPSRCGPGPLHDRLGRSAATGRIRLRNTLRCLNGRPSHARHERRVAMWKGFHRCAMPQSSPTIRDIAREAGVAVGTVSRVLNSSGPVSLVTAKRVRAVMDRLGYVPSDAGRALRTGESRVLGLLVPTISNPIFARSLEGIESVLHARGYAALLVSTGYDSAIEAEALSTLAFRGVDGLIATLADGAAAPDTGVPTVLLYNRPDGPEAVLALATVDSRTALRAARCDGPDHRTRPSSHRILGRPLRRLRPLGGPRRGLLRRDECGGLAGLASRTGRFRG